MVNKVPARGKRGNSSRDGHFTAFGATATAWLGLGAPLGAAARPLPRFYLIKINVPGVSGRTTSILCYPRGREPGASPFCVALQLMHIKILGENLHSRHKEGEHSPRFPCFRRNGLLETLKHPPGMNFIPHFSAQAPINLSRSGSLSRVLFHSSCRCRGVNNAFLCTIQCTTPRIVERNRGFGKKK